MNVLDVGKSIYFLLTPNCNLSCRYCYQHESRRRIYSNIEGMNQHGVYATPEVIEGLVSYCVRNGIEHVEFFGGEPLYYPDLLQSTIVKLCHRIPSVTIGIVTNGTLLAEQIMTIIETKPISILLSLDGNRDRHDLLRGEFDRITRWIPRLVKQGRTGVAMQAGIIHDLYKNLEWIWSRGLINVYINVIENYGWYSTNDVEEFKSEYELAIKGMLEGRGKLNCAIQMHQLLQQTTHCQGCGITGQGLACDWLGKLYPCHRAMEIEKDLSIGDIFNGSDKPHIQSIRMMIEKKVFQSRSARNYPLVSYCPIAIYQQHTDFAADWNREYCAMISAKAQLVSKYYYEISNLIKRFDLAEKI